MKRKILSNNQAEGFLKVIVVLMGVMMAIAIGAIVAFAIISGTGDGYQTIDTHTVYNAGIDQFVNLSTNPEAGSFTVLYYNGTWNTVPAANITENTNRTITVQAGGIQINTTQLKATYNMKGANTNTNLITYAVLMFGLLVIIPVVIVGGLMLKSLGYFGGSKV